MLKYKQFNESRLSTSGKFYLKKIKDSKSGKSALYGFEIKREKHSIWIANNAIYNKIDNKIPKLPSDYKSLVIGAFIFNPDSWDDSYDIRTKFFDNYNKYMQPVIDRLNKNKEDVDNADLVESFRNTISKMLAIKVRSYDKKSNSIETDIGPFYIYKRNPLTFRIGDVTIEKQEEGLHINYNNEFYVKATGKNGLIAKALIKINSNQQLNAAERMSIQRIYIDCLKRHDWEFDMADDKRSRAYGKNNSNKLNVLGKILNKLGLTDYVKSNYDKYNPKSL